MSNENTSSSVQKKSNSGPRHPSIATTASATDCSDLYTMHSVSTLHNQLARERCKSELRQLGSLLLILGAGSAISAVALKAVLIEGRAGNKQIQGFRLPALLAVLIQIFGGLCSMVMGLIVAVLTPTDARFHTYSKLLLWVINLGPIAFVITLTRLAQGATEPLEDMEYIPMVLHPTKVDLQFTIAMGCLALFAVCASLTGGLTVVGLNLCAFLGGQPHDKNRPYYVIRYGYYCLVVWIGGFSQLALGLYLWSRWGAGPLEQAVHVTTYTVYFPPMTALTGLVQCLWGLQGFGRSIGWFRMGGPRDHSFWKTGLIAWSVTMFFQVLLQPSYGAGTDFNAEGATYASVYMGFFVMPPWLDYLVRVTPVKVRPEDYGFDKDTPMKHDFLVKLFYGTPDGSKEKVDADEHSSNFEDEEERPHPQYDCHEP